MKVAKSDFEAKIIENMKNYKCRLGSKKEVNDFLLSGDLNKDNFERFFAYLMKFKIIKPTTNSDKLAKQLHLLASSYFPLREKVLGDKINSPLDILPKKTSYVINADVDRCINWFREMLDNALNMKISEKEMEQVQRAMERILVICESAVAKVAYIQGTDRFGFGIIALAINFSFNVLKIRDVEFCEAISFALIAKLLIVADLKGIIDVGCENPLFKRIDSYIEKKYEDDYKMMESAQQSSFLFAFRWRLIFFSDEEEMRFVYNIWDLLIAHSGSTEIAFDDMFYCLCAAHIDDFESTKDCKGELVERIMNYKNWNIENVIASSKKMFKSEFETKKLTTFLILFAFLQMIVIIFLLRNK